VKERPWQQVGRCGGRLRSAGLRCLGVSLWVSVCGAMKGGCVAFRCQVRPMGVVPVTSTLAEDPTPDPRPESAPL
jgi:hypothetical protein